MLSLYKGETIRARKVPADTLDVSIDWLLGRSDVMDVTEKPESPKKAGEEDVAVLLFPDLHITASGIFPREGQAAHIRARWSLVPLWQQGLSSDVRDPARLGHASASALVKNPALALSFLLSPQAPA